MYLRKAEAEVIFEARRPWNCVAQDTLATRVSMTAAVFTKAPIIDNTRWIYIFTTLFSEGNTV